MRQTLADKTHRTPANDLGHENTSRLSTERCLQAMLQGPETPLPRTRARKSRKTVRTRRTKKTPVPVTSPPPAPVGQPSETLHQPGLSAPVHLENGRWGCWYDGCGKSYAHAHDATRHYSSVHAGDNWQCRKCRTSFTRHDNAWRHVKEMHDIDEGIDEWIVEIQGDGDEVAPEMLGNAQ
ncbi:hypothetical protein DENSPDRAFT_279918 [Dentipellis sp. KUC8613]|nr:hypothetical protein DENSPDRAFT_279918 [Dentipellis sp. KUC8613]